MRGWTRDLAQQPWRGTKLADYIQTRATIGLDIAKSPDEEDKLVPQLKHRHRREGDGVVGIVDVRWRLIAWA